MEGKTAETALAGIDAHRQKYKLLEQQLLQRKARLILKQPEIQKALDIVNMLQERQEEEATTIDYELAEGVYARSKVQGVQTVHLWLGADVMVEYGLQDAKVRHRRRSPSLWKIPGTTS
jgi:hypothetical protein